MHSLGGKLLAVFLYMIPWADSLTFGNHLYIKYPIFQIITIPAIPNPIAAIVISLSIRSFG